MAGWEETPYGWEDTHGRYQVTSHRKDLRDIPNKKFDVIIVMAGGLNDEGDIHPWVENRLNLVIELYKKSQTKIICTGGGTYHKPPALNEEKFVIHESTACAEYLINNDVNPHDIMKEWGSYDTIASVYFTLLLCVSPHDWKDICVVTSSFHMPRVKLLFEWIFSLHDKYRFTFLEAPDDNLDQEIIAIRNIRERQSHENMLELKNRIRTKEAFNEWLFAEHKAYACNFMKKKESISDEEKRSY